MAANSQQTFSVNETRTGVRPITVFILVLGIFLGVIAGLYVLPQWLPGFAQSLTGTQPKVFWYLARGSAVVAYFLLWFSMVFGVTVTNKMAAKWPGLARTNGLHQYVSILGLSFGLFHGLILLGDQYMGFSLWQIFVPFAITTYHPFLTGLGQMGFYAWLVIVVSFYLRKKIGIKVWRGIHFASYFTYLAVLFHALLGGTDTGLPWMQWIYWISGGLLLFFTVYRIFYEVERRHEKSELAAKHSG